MPSPSVASGRARSNCSCGASTSRKIRVGLDRPFIWDILHAEWIIRIVPPMGATGSGPRSRPLLFWGLAAGTILAGFVDLWRGGETLAPILLVVGYCMLVPVAILKG